MADSRLHRHRHRRSLGANGCHFTTHVCELVQGDIRTEAIEDYLLRLERTYLALGTHATDPFQSMGDASTGFTVASSKLKLLRVENLDSDRPGNAALANGSECADFAGTERFVVGSGVDRRETA